MTDDQITDDRSAFMQEQRSKREAAYEEGFDDGAKEAYAEGRKDEREEASAIPPGYALVPDYRGFAHLGTGQYLLNISAAGDPPELVISIASEKDKDGRTVGDFRDNPPGTVIQPEQMAVRLRFASEAGLAALERHLHILREEHFASPT